MCVIYFFAGLDKFMGQVWRDGTAVWWAVANLEYQSLDMTWLAAWPSLVAVMTYVTVFWEISYPALIWPRLSRPVVLLLAVVVHVGHHRDVEDAAPRAIGPEHAAGGVVAVEAAVVHAEDDLQPAVTGQVGERGAPEGGAARRHAGVPFGLALG